METKWTPGPWPIKPTGDFKRIVIGDGLVEGPGGYEVAEVYSDDCDRDEAMANAHLIAAAPDLYAALVDLMAAYAEPDRQICCNGQHCGCQGSTVQQMAEHYANQALAKARGEA